VFDQEKSVDICETAFRLVLGKRTSAINI